MADAKKCDRCGAYYEFKNDFIRICDEKGYSMGSYDLCPSCMNELKKFLRGKKDE